MNEINKSIKGMNKEFSRQQTLKISNGDVRNEKLSKSKKKITPGNPHNRMNPMEHGLQVLKTKSMDSRA